MTPWSKLYDAVLQGGSMRPWLPVHPHRARIRLFGSGEAASRFRAGDVLVLRLGGAWVAHRALRAGRATAYWNQNRSSGRTGAARGGGIRPPTAGDWLGRPDVAPPVFGLLGRVSSVRLGGRWWNLESPAARLTGLATNALIGVLTRIGGRRLLSPFASAHL